MCVPCWARAFPKAPRFDSSVFRSGSFLVLLSLPAVFCGPRSHWVPPQASRPRSLPPYACQVLPRGCHCCSDRSPISVVRAARAASLGRRDCSHRAVPSEPVACVSPQRHHDFPHLPISRFTGGANAPRGRRDCSHRAVPSEPVACVSPQQHHDFPHLLISRLRRRKRPPGGAATVPTCLSQLVRLRACLP